MSWVRLDDQYDVGKRRVEDAGPDGPYVHIRALLHCARQLSDGHLKATAIPIITAHLPGTRGRKALAKLVEVGLLHKPGHSCPDCPAVTEGYYVHDYLHFQPSKEQVLEERRKARERMQGVRANKPRTGGEKPAKFGSPVPVPEVLSEPPPPNPPEGGVTRLRRRPRDARPWQDAWNELDQSWKVTEQGVPRPVFNDPALEIAVQRLGFRTLGQMRPAEALQAFKAAYCDAQRGDGAA